MAAGEERGAAEGGGGGGGEGGSEKREGARVIDNHRPFDASSSIAENVYSNHGVSRYKTSHANVKSLSVF